MSTQLTPEEKMADILIDEMASMFTPLPPGYRPAHAKGLMVSGKFTPTPEAATLSTAPIFNGPTDITARLSSATGFYKLPDYHPAGHPRGLALRFHFGNYEHADILVQSSPHFPVKDGGEEFYLFLKAVQDKTNMLMMELAKTRPYLQAFIASTKTMPSSFARDEYWSVNAFQLIHPKQSNFVRYLLLPDPKLGTDYLDAAALASLAGGEQFDFLYDDIKERLSGTGFVTFRLKAQVAGRNDNPKDSSVHWPETNRLVDLGEVRLETAIPEEHQIELNKTTIFDPLHTGPGIMPSDDPLLATRHVLYNRSGERRRAAQVPEAAEKIQRCPFHGSVVLPEHAALSSCH